jgi:cytoskeletal protein RodZ
MKELGEFLKSERIKMGLTLEEIQEITKIRIRYLKAIEDGDFSVMPA